MYFQQLILLRETDIIARNFTVLAKNNGIGIKTFGEMKIFSLSQSYEREWGLRRKKIKFSATDLWDFFVNAKIYLRLVCTN